MPDAGGAGVAVAVAAGTAVAATVAAGGGVAGGASGAVAGGVGRARVAAPTRRRPFTNHRRMGDPPGTAAAPLGGAGLAPRLAQRPRELPLQRLPQAHRFLP